MPRFADPWQLGSRALTGSPTPTPASSPPIAFDHEAADGRDDVVLAHLNHRLVQMCLRLLRAEVWAPTDRKKTPPRHRPPRAATPPCAPPP